MFLYYLCAPIILLYYALLIYCLPCIWIYIQRCLCACMCAMCCCCRKCCHHKDKKFPPNASSIGKWKNMTPAEIDSKIVWKPADEIFTRKFTLFAGGISPTDISQGELGNCWLLSAIACLAEFPGAVQRVFVTKEYSVLGKYTVNIFDRPKNKWVKVTIDDCFPCHRSNGKPIYAAPQGEELWVLILEKAFAKFCGDYESLAGGHCLWGLEALTGDYVWRYSTKDHGRTWNRLDMIHLDRPNNKRAIGLRTTQERHSDEDLFRILRRYDKRNAVLSAGTHGNDDTKKTNNGLVCGHAYSILRLKKSGKFRMILLRNPWGAEEWSGAWSDNSAMWNKHPKVKKDCKLISTENDGIFWMEFSDFVRNFKSIDVCDRSTGFGDLALDTHEDKGPCGPCRGCCVGMSTFFCCCFGCKKMCCGHESRNETLSAKGSLTDALV